MVQLRDDTALLGWEETEDYSIEETKLALVVCGVLLRSEVVYCPLSNCISTFHGFLSGVVSASSTLD